MLNHLPTLKELQKPLLHALNFLVDDHRACDMNEQQADDMHRFVGFSPRMRI